MRSYLLMFLMMARVCCAEDAPEVPTDFTRDVMQPIGVPIVSSYHAMRESLFLNTRIDPTHPLEILGNWSLTPSQYLFAGKAISIEENGGCKTEQIFSYEHLHWLKTTAAMIALPLSEVVGSIFKGLSFLIPEVREKHRRAKQLLCSSMVTSHLERYRNQGIERLHCDEFIPCQGLARPSTLTKKQKIELKALKAVTELLDAHHIVYWIDCGTCLGAYRYGGIIPWDWDIDIAIFAEDHDNVKKLLSTLNEDEYQIQDWSSYSKPKTFMKLYVKETKNFLDIYHYKIDEQKREVGYVFTYIDSPFPKSWKVRELKCITPVKYEEVFPLKKAKFDHLTVWAPNHVVAFLQSKYGENLDPTMAWDEASQTYQKVESHPYYN